MSDNNKGRGIFYGVIGVATLVVAIIGATFAYFTATAANTATIKGNTAKVELSLAVEKISNADETKGGMIPLANSMVERAVYGIHKTNPTEDVKKTVLTGATADICVDDNGNAVCQVYKITLNNSSATSVFVDGYVSLKGGSGTPNDYTYALYSAKKNKFKLNDFTAPADTTTENPSFNTTMRWAQLIKNGDSYSTAGDFQLGAVSTEKVTFTDIGVASDTTGEDAKNEDNIRDQYVASTDPSNKGVYGKLAINGTDQYNVIDKNYIRVSDHNWTADGSTETYTRADDVTSALVYNHYLKPNEEKNYYIVVWLTENGSNQTTGQDKLTPAAASFFAGNVTFVSAQGNEVSATFQSYARVQSNNGARQ